MDLQTPGAERRRFARFLVDFPISYALKNSHEVSTGMAMNLSEGGLLAHFFERLGTGTELNLEMFYRYEYQFTALKTQARIVWKDIFETHEAIEFQYGIEFIGLEDKTRERLRRLLATVDDTSSFV